MTTMVATATATAWCVIDFSLGMHYIYSLNRPAPSYATLQVCGDGLTALGKDLSRNLEAERRPVDRRSGEPFVLTQRGFPSFYSPLEYIIRADQHRTQAPMEW